MVWVDVINYYAHGAFQKLNDLGTMSKKICFSFQFQPGEFSASAVKNEGRVIHYNVVDDHGNIVDEEDGECSFLFKGSGGVQELTQMLQEETGLTEVTLCSRSPLNGKLYPMRLALPPNHVKLHVFVVPSSSKG